MVSIPSAPPRSPRDVALDAARDPIPAAVERSPTSRMHWRHGLDVDPALAGVVVDTPATPREWSALLAETHAGLLDPDGTIPLARPSPLGRTVGEALRASDAWQPLSDAAQAHPLIAREAVTELASVVLDALKSAGAKPGTDTRASLAALDAARAAAERARKAIADATTPEQKREALKASIEAKAAEERATGAVRADEAMALRAGAALDAAEATLVRIADEATGKAEATHAFNAALGTGQGVGGTLPVSDDVVRALTPEVTRMLRMVGAMRKALSKGRATRHLKGREGMIGVGQGGLDRAADLTTLGLASLAGHLGAPLAGLTRLALVEGSAPVTEKGGGVARDGDVVLVVDKSGSMRAHDGAPDMWASALALAVLIEARADGRNAGLVTYDGGVRFAALVDSSATLADAVVALSTEAGGSNNERAALQAAATLLAGMPHGGNPADVVLVTDGQWEASNLADGGVERARLRGVFIGGTAPVGAGFASTWEVRATVGTDDASAGADLALAVEIAAVTV